MIPVSKTLNQALSKFTNGNYALWFYKFLELDESIKGNFKPLGKEAAYDKIKDKYESIGQTQQTENLLDARHVQQMACMESFKSQYEPLVFRARLTRRLISGMGYTHPTETGITLDHNMGIPYLPAASIKGLVRAARRFECGYMDENHDDDPETKIPLIFGDEKNMGRVMFMDAYPVKPPKIEVEIITPHYSDYYSKKKLPPGPGDWMAPVLIKFLAVAAGTEYIFRALVDKKYATQEMLDSIKATYVQALCDVGAGAKTAVGYGRFEIVGEEESPDMIKKKVNWLDKQRSPEEKKTIARKAILDKLLYQTDANMVNRLFNDWQADATLAQDKILARTFKTKLRRKKNSGEWTAPYKTVCAILGEGPLEDARGQSNPVLNVAGGNQSQKEKNKQKLERLIARGKISKKEFKKLKSYRKDWPDLYAELAKLVK